MTSDITTDRSLIMDIDGTLIDSNYQHVIAWQRALRAHGVEAQGWIIHRYVGKGGDQMVTSVAGEDVERDLGDAIRGAEKDAFGELMEEVTPLPGALEFLSRARDLGFGIVLSSSAKAEEVEHYIELLGAEDVIKGFTTSAEVEATKPEPDLIEAALEMAGDSVSVMVGDSIWDVEAARRADLECLAVLTGGFSKSELLAAGATEVQPALLDLSILG